MICIFLIVLVRAEREAHLAVYTEHIGQLEISSLILISGRLTHTDEAASLIHKASDIGQDLFVDPVLRAAECGVRIPDINDDLDFLRDAVPDIIKGNELDLKRHSA